MLVVMLLLPIQISECILQIVNKNVYSLWLSTCYNITYVIVKKACDTFFMFVMGMLEECFRCFRVYISTVDMRTFRHSRGKQASLNCPTFLVHCVHVHSIHSQSQQKNRVL